MFALVVHEPARDRGHRRPSWRVAFPRREVRIGRAPDNELVLDAPGVSDRHARLVCKDGKYIVVDMKSEGGTWVNGRRAIYPQVVRTTDAITVADIRLEIVTLVYEELARQPVTARDLVEAELLAAIDRDEEGSRLVYADWLEEHGDHARAEVLRLQGDPSALPRVRELVANLELPWRARVLELPVENCLPKLKFACPARWSALQSTGVEGERHCATCARTVFYCATVDEARTHAAHGRCVAIDVASPRWRGDLDAPFGRTCATCNFDVGSGPAVCPRCGEPVEDEMIMGELA